MRRLLLPLITSLLFSGSFIAGKLTTYDLGPLTTTLLRYTAALAFLSILIAKYKKRSLKLNKKDIFKVVLCGFFGIVGYHYFFFTSLRYTRVANTGIINATIPVFIALFASIFLKERLILKNYTGTGLAFTGVVILISRGNIEKLISLDFSIGDLLMLFAVLSWVIYSLLIKSLSDEYKSYTLTFYATFFGVLFLIPLSLTENLESQLKTISLSSTLSVLYMGIFASGIGIFLYNQSIKTNGATVTASCVYSFVPVLVALHSSIFFKESIGPSIIASLVLIIAGLNLALSKPEKNKMR